MLEIQEILALVEHLELQEMVVRVVTVVLVVMQEILD
jgi:hypothetical protein